MSNAAIDAIVNRLYDLQASNPEEAQKLIEQVKNPNVFDRLDIANASLADKFRAKLAQVQAEISLAQEDPDNNLNTMNLVGGFSGGIKTLGAKALKGVGSELIKDAGKGFKIKYIPGNPGKTPAYVKLINPEGVEAGSMSLTSDKINGKFPKDSDKLHAISWSEIQPEYRKKGFYKKMMDAAVEGSKNEGFAGVITDAQSPLSAKQWDKWTNAETVVNKYGRKTRVLKDAPETKGMGLEEAKALLKSIPTDEMAVALKGKDRAAYLEALDTVYGNAEKRAKDMGFSDETFYHGNVVSPEELTHFDEKKTTHNYPAFVTPDKSVAKFFAKRASDIAYDHTKTMNIHELKLRGEVKDPYMVLKKAGLLDSHPDGWDLNNTWKTIEHGGGVKEYLDSKDIKNVLMSEQTGNKRLDKYGQGTSRTVAVSDPSVIRSKFAAFDPRFKNSKKIMAGTAGGLLGGKMLADEMGLLDE